MRDVLQIIYLLGAVQGAFLAALLAGRRRNSLPNRLLAVAMLVFSIDLAMAAYHESGTDLRFPHLIGIDVPLTLLYGPVIYLYAHAMTAGNRLRLGRRVLLHFVPFILLTLYMVPFYVQPPDVKVAILSGTIALATVDGLAIINPLKVLHGVAYVGLTFVILRRHRRRVRDTLSYAERVNLDWLRNLMIGMVALAAIATVLYVANLRYHIPLLGMDSGHPYDNLTLLAVTIFVYAIGYLGLRQPEIFHPRLAAASDDAPSDEKPAGPRYARTGIDPETATRHLHALLDLMEEEKPYRRGDLTLQDLADALGISPHNLTEVLNTHVGNSFYDFVNQYRVREVQERLESSAYRHWSILAIGLEAGFNSKSAFYAVFKKHTDLTPSEYRKLRTVDA